MNFTELLKKTMSKRSASTCRIFHGPGEGQGFSKNISIDKFSAKFNGKLSGKLSTTTGSEVGNHAWVSCELEGLKDDQVQLLTSALQHTGFLSAAIIYRRKKGEDTEPSQGLFGIPPDKLEVENCGLKFLVSLKNQRQPGLFLDLDFVRKWLLKNSKAKVALNLFSYTGSLSVAAGRGGAAAVTSVDLSKSYTEWAKQNWGLNQLEGIKSDFIYGDVFDWLKKFKKQERLFDLVACDPPSFSRSKSSFFSTAKDTTLLHEGIFSILKPGGQIVTSINTETISREEFLAQIQEAAKNSGRKIKVETEFGLPPEFPVPTGRDSYLKGAVIQATN